jgi:hypothetical protein
MVPQPIVVQARMVPRLLAVEYIQRLGRVVRTRWASAPGRVVRTRLVGQALAVRVVNASPAEQDLVAAATQLSDLPRPEAARSTLARAAVRCAPAPMARCATCMMRGEAWTCIMG